MLIIFWHSNVFYLPLQNIRVKLYLCHINNTTKEPLPMKRFLCLLTATCLSIHISHAQTETAYTIATSPFQQAFKHLDLSLTTGTTGLGFDLATPITDMVQLRTGFSFMPHFSHIMHFGVQVGEDPTTSESKFERLSELLNGFTGYKVDNQVDMIGIPTYWNWNLMADIKPFRNKNWHFTVGFYLGSSKIAKAYNTTEDMPSLMAVGIYNNMYDKAMNDEPFFNISGIDAYHPEFAEKFKNYGRMSIHLGEYTHDVYYDEDVVMTTPGGDFIGDDYYDEGDIIYHGSPWVDANGVEHGPDVKYHKGDAYRMVPDENSMAKAWAYANRFKPYLGFGYGGRLLKNDDRWNISFDAGVMFWGGTPKIITHDGTDMINDVENVQGHVGDYVDLIKKFKVFPVLNLRITRRLF